MQLILTGCEYVGKRTLGRRISEWWGEQTGAEAPPFPHTGFHDHFVVPSVIHTGGHDSHKEQSEQDILKLNPGILEHFQRYQIDYHFQRSFASSPDLRLIDWYYGDAVFAPLYYGYGRAGEYGDRRVMVRYWDFEVVELMPDMVLVLMTASPDVIRQRKREYSGPWSTYHTKSIFQEKDVEFVLDRFQEEFDQSLIERRFTLDTSSATVEQTLGEFVEKMEPYLTPRNRLDVAKHQMTKEN